MQSDLIDQLLAANPGVIYALDVSGDAFVPSWVSSNIERILGYTVTEAMQPRWWSEHVHPADREHTVAQLPMLFDRDYLSIDYRFQNKSGAYRWVQDQLQLVRDAEGTPVQAVGTWLDITERKADEQRNLRLQRAYRMLSRTNEALARVNDSRELFRQICQIIVDCGGFRLAWVGLVREPDGIVQPVACAGSHVDYLAGVTIRVDRESAEGRGPVGSALREDRAFVCQDVGTDPSFAPWRDRALANGFRAVIAHPLRVEGQVAGGLALYADDSNCLDDEELDLIARMAENVSFGMEALEKEVARRKAETEIRHLAYHDPLTGLSNRVSLHEQLTHTITAAAANGSAVALLVLGIAGFDEVNFALGYANGDLLLREAAARLVKQAGPGWTVARLGASVFGVIIDGIQSLKEAGAAARRFMDALETPMSLEGVPIDIRAHAGLAFYPHHADTAERLLRRAESAKAVAKRSRTGLLVYSPDHEVKRSGLALIAELKQALKARQLILAYQPKISLKSGRVTDVEALVRWKHPQKGLIPPADFIPAAEHTGLISQITSYVLDVALVDAARWRTAGLDLSVCVNISARDLHEPGFASKVKSAVKRHGGTPSRLTLELTESVVMEKPEHSIGLLEEFSTMGIQVSVDDFGTGYSSLAYLKRLPINELKIDRAFVKNMIGSKDDALIVKSTIALAHELGLRVTAEGVEDALTFEELRRLDCDKAQGFRIAKPMAADALEKWATSRISGPKRASG